MQKKKYTSSFCSSCQKNVPHRRWVGNPLVLVFDLLTLRCARWLRIGPWYCVHCDSRSVLLPLRRPDAIDYRSAALGNERELANPRKRTGSSDSSSPPPSQTPPPTPTKPVNAELEPAQSVGNFIKTESSLVMKSNRLQRYSEKYRDAVVRRILTGTSSIKQVREEKQLSETEVTDWIADLFERQQQRIDTLELFKKSVTQSELLSDQAFQDLAADSQSIPGQVRPR